ncbi:plasmid replication initiator TrfA [Azotobacter salinestris]|uniref:plasmid replication initiator TrfA n=1 Tax=Azotobacter salinestris TaxID=69964 RepID=UPI0032E039EC
MDKLKRMQERNVRGKEAEPSAPAAEPVQPSAQVIRLPLWGEGMRGVPNGLLRSALFGAIAKGKRRFIKGEQIAAIEGVEIRYTGERLDQGDLDVWESVLHLARVQALGDECRVTSYALLKLMGKTDTGKNRTTLQTRIERLRANAVTVKQGRYSYIGGLVDEAYKDEETQAWVIVVNPKLHALYATDQFTQVEWSVRHALDGKPLAQWLHSFYASHAKPYPMRIETLHKLCGSETARMDHYRQDLRKALDAVTAACEAHGEGFSYEIRGNLVHVEKKPSRAQRRHLAKEPRKPRG